MFWYNANLTVKHSGTHTYAPHPHTHTHIPFPLKADLHWTEAEQWVRLTMDVGRRSLPVPLLTTRWRSECSGRWIEYQISEFRHQVTDLVQEVIDVEYVSCWNTGCQTVRPHCTLPQPFHRSKWDIVFPSSLSRGTKHNIAPNQHQTPEVTWELSVMVPPCRKFQCGDRVAER